MRSIKLIDREMQHLQDQADGHLKQAQKAGALISLDIDDAMGIAGDVRQATHENQTAKQLLDQKSKLEAEKVQIQSAITDVEAEIKKQNDDFQLETARREDDHRRHISELESKRLNLIG